MRSRISGAGTPRFSSPKAISCHTVSHTIWLSGLWNTNPMEEAEVRASIELTSMPPTSTVPRRSPAGATSGLQSLSKVVLPEPVSPTSSANAPFGTSTST